MIIDSSDLKADLEYKHYKMENLQTALDLCVPGYFCLLLGTYSERWQEIFDVQVAGVTELFQYTCLPNGLAQAPRKFTKILKPVLGKLQQQGHSCFAYIDDTFFMAESFQGCKKSIESLRETLIRFRSALERLYLKL